MFLIVRKSFDVRRVFRYIRSFPRNLILESKAIMVLCAAAESPSRVRFEFFGLSMSVIPMFEKIYASGSKNYLLA
jgi:hypothetical protein